MQLSRVGLQNCQRASLKVRLQTSTLVRGVACLDDDVGRIYVVCRDCDTVAVFHATPPYEQLRGIRVSGLREPTDMAACDANRILYVSDWAERCVWQVTPGGKVDWRLPAWSPSRRKAAAVSPLSLSVRSGRLVVVEPDKVSLCSAHDERMEEIRFPESVTLHHAAETEHRSLVVALTDSGADKSRGAIREMKPDHSGDWIVVRELDLSSALLHTPVSEPRCMAWDSSGCLYVVADSSSRVLVVDDSLNVVRSVRLSKRSLPHRMCFLSRRGMPMLAADAGFSVNLYAGIIPTLQYPMK